MSTSPRPIVPILVALAVAAVPASVLTQAPKRRAAAARLAAVSATPGYDPLMSRVCEKSCAVKIPFQESELAPQPDAPAGRLTRCPVSGVVFRAREEGPRALEHGRAYRFCCNSCARLFRADARRFVKS